MKRIFAIILLTSVSQLVLATHEESSSITGSVGRWSADFSGKIGDFNTELKELGITKADNTHYRVALEHSTPLLPHVHLDNTSVSTTGTGTLTASYSIGDQTFTATTEVESKLSLSFTDLTFYYKPLRNSEVHNYAGIDIGVVLRKFDADASVTSINLTPTLSDSESVDGVLPMGYLKASINLPFGTYLSAERKTISYEEKSLSDTRVAIGYRITPLLRFSDNTTFGIEAGQRTLEIDLGTDEDFAGDIELSGSYVGLMIGGSF